MSEEISNKVKKIVADHLGIDEAKGTAYKSKSEKIKFSGKTGTSQVTRITVEKKK